LPVSPDAAGVDRGAAFGSRPDSGKIRRIGETKAPRNALSGLTPNCDWTTVPAVFQPEPPAAVTTTVTFRTLRHLPGEDVGLVPGV
jgi:hypothetical protein